MTTSVVPGLITWTCRAGLALVLLTSATAKARRPSSVADYLRPVFGAAGNVLAYAVIVAELVLATLLIFWRSPAAYWCALAAMLALTLFYAVRLTATNDVLCACWGHVEPDESRSLKQAVGHPVLLAWRNGILAGAALAPLNGLPLFAYGSAGLLQRLLAGMAATEIIITIGLGTSIIRKLYILRNYPDDHPLALMYMTRWVRVRGCRTFDLDTEESALRS